MSTAITRQIVLDTETTGMNQIGAHYEGHKIIEIGAVEVVNRRLTGNNFHVYLKPDRLVDPEAFGVHGIADEFLLDKPTFAEVADEFMDNKVKQQFSALYVRQVSYALFLRQMKSLQLMKPVLIWWRRRAEAASGGHKYL